jgi:hypothetical protein
MENTAWGRAESKTIQFLVPPVGPWVLDFWGKSTPLTTNRAAAQHPPRCSSTFPPPLQDTTPELFDGFVNMISSIFRQTRELR